MLFLLDVLHPWPFLLPSLRVCLPLTSSFQKKNPSGNIIRSYNGSHDAVHPQTHHRVYKETDLVASTVWNLPSFRHCVYYVCILFILLTLMPSVRTQLLQFRCAQSYKKFTQPGLSIKKNMLQVFFFSRAKFQLPVHRKHSQVIVQL